MSTFVIRNATGLDGTVGTLAIRDGVFVPPDSLSGIKGVVTVDASGLQALPGLVDLHTHLRQPGAEGAETIASGSRAAALGGYTAVHAMANTDPVADNAERVCDVWNWGRQAGYVDVRPVGAVTEGLLGLHLSDMASMAQSFAAVRVFSDDGKCVHDDDMMRSALHNAHAVGGVVAQHAQAPHLTQGAVMNAGRLAATLGLVGWPAVAEESIIERDIALASEVGARLHVCHVSTSGSVGLIREAKARGVAVTAEVTPHHLLLTEELVTGFDPLFKVNPPLRTTSDTIALRQALAEGVIDVIATDHAPHPAEAKDTTFPEAAFGMLGLESALGVAITTMVESGMMGYQDIARVMSSAPAAIGRLGGYDNPLALGAPAHLTLVDPTATTPHPRASLSHNNPYRDMSLRGRAMFTFYGGVVTVREGELVEREADES